MSIEYSHFFNSIKKSGIENKTKTKTKESRKLLYDVKLRQKVGAYWGAIKMAYLSNNDANYTDENRARLNEVFNDIQRIFNDLAWEKKVKSIQEGDGINNFADGLAILSDHFSAYKEHQAMGYMEYPEDLQKEIKARDYETRDVFIEVCSKLFQEVKAPNSSKEAIAILKDMLKSAAQLPIEMQARTGLEFILGSKTVLEMANRIDAQIQHLGRMNGYFGNLDMEGNEEFVKSQNKENVIKVAKFIYQLELIRQQLQKEGSSDFPLKESVSAMKKEANIAISFLQKQLGYPFRYDQRFDMLPDQKFKKFANEIIKLAKAWRTDKQRRIPGSNSTNEYIAKINALIDKYRP